jgi:hypothetical protein
LDMTYEIVIGPRLKVLMTRTLFTYSWYDERG